MNLIKALLHEIHTIEPNQRQIRQFGWMWFVILTFLIPAWKWYSLNINPSEGDFSISLAGLGLLIASYLIPKSIAWPYRLWMGLGLILGLIFGNLVVAIVFYLVITPIGLINRATGTHFMPLRPDKDAKTYWKERSEPFTKKDFERQF